MPIFEITFSRPLPTALIARSCASARERSMRPSSTSCADRREHQVRVDGGGAVADQHGDALHAARLAGLDDEAGLQPRPGANEVVVDRADREQRRDRRARRARRRGRRGRGCSRRRASASSASAHSRSRACSRPAGAVVGRPGDVERVRLEDVRVDLPQALELVVAQDRVVDHELACVLGRLVEQVPLRADERRTLITTASRVESIGGFVTCAKSCLKYE